MAGETRTYTSNYDSSMRESISDTIVNIAPTECVFTNSIGKGKAKAKYEQWQEDTLTAPSAANKQIEGDDVTATEITYPDNSHNYTQYSYKVFKLADVMEYVDKVGRSSEQAYQKGRHLAMLKTEIEYDMLNTAAEAAGNSTTARASCGVKGFIATNVNAGGWTTSTATTQLLTEDLFNDLVQDCYDVGGKPNLVLAPGTIKRKISAFNGNNRLTVNTDDGDKKVINTIDYYETDFGTVKVMPSRFLAADSSTTHKTLLVLQKDMWEQLILMPFRTVELAKHGPSKTFMIDVEYTLKCKSEKANAMLRYIYAP
jgi:hypothetical protein